MPRDRRQLPSGSRSQQEIAETLLNSRRRAARRANRRIGQTELDGLVAAARIQAAGYAAHVGVIEAALISSEVNRLVEQSNATDPASLMYTRARLHAIADAYAHTVSMEIAELGE